MVSTPLAAPADPALLVSADVVRVARTSEGLAFAGLVLADLSVARLNWRLMQGERILLVAVDRERRIEAVWPVLDVSGHDLEGRRNLRLSSPSAEDRALVGQLLPVDPQSAIVYWDPQNGIGDATW
ncbi:hypothetical protein [Rhodococcus wratislaviensis]|uniref:hypothetical protein n=1 Tax=Rhodococcus wratislaviensis TaxID=44752 RepID=UPI000F583F29|nr:hypothetical protein [Rhodococcus wratislaviensis]